MRLAGLDRASDLMCKVVEDAGDENKVYLSAMVFPSHKRLIEQLASINRANQADVVRAIIDEWCEQKLLEVGGA